MDIINAQHPFQDGTSFEGVLTGSYRNADHFVGCEFLGSTLAINGRYRDAVGIADPSSIFPAAARYVDVAIGLGKVLRFDGLVAALFEGLLVGGLSFDDAPDEATLDHDRYLYKDSPTRPDGSSAALLRAQARQTAYLQTRHEFRRLCHMIRDAYGQAAVDELFRTWVKSDPASQAQARELCEGGEARDAVFVIDTTESMEDDIDAVKEAAGDMINVI